MLRFVCGDVVEGGEGFEGEGRAEVEALEVFAVFISGGDGLVVR